MVFKKLRSVLGLSTKEKQALCPADLRKMEKTLKEKLFDSLFGYDRAFNKLQLQLLKQEIEIKGRSVSEQISRLKDEPESEEAQESIKETPEEQPAEVSAVEQLPEQEQPAEKPQDLTEDILTCKICCESYSKERRLPLVGVCGHTLCRSCVRSLQTEDCPLCRCEDSFCVETRNFLVYEMLEQLNKFPEEEENDGPEASPRRDRDDEEDEEDWDDEDEDGEEDDEEEEEDGLVRLREHESDFLELRAEVCHLLRGANEQQILSRLAGSYDHIWYLIFAHSLRGHHSTRLQQLKRMISPASPYYQSLKNAANDLHNWGCRVRRSRCGTACISGGWMEGSEVPQLTEDVRHRLRLLLIFASPFQIFFHLLERDDQIEEMAGASIFVIQFFDEQRDEMVIDQNYIPPWLQ